jgi:cytochrome c551/c552
MKRFFLATIILVSIYACGNQDGTTVSATVKSEATDNSSYDPNRGEGKFKTVNVSDKLNIPMADKGLKIFSVKCSSCHKTTAEKLVGPGWTGVTKRYTAPWIMNFITNTDAMITKDPKAQAQLEICLVRMPNQNLSDDDARNLYEYMRKNDGVK